MAIVRKDWKEQSRINWGLDMEENEFPGREAVQLGAVLRIADATEAMARNHTSLVEEKERYRRWYGEEQARNAKLWRRLNAMRGVITRLKKNNGKYHVKH